MLFAFGALFALGLFVAVLAGAVLLASRMWQKPWSTVPLVALIALLAFAPLALMRPTHGAPPSNTATRLAFIWLAELQVLYGVPLFVAPFAVVRWLVRRTARSRAA